MINENKKKEEEVGKGPVEKSGTTPVTGSIKTKKRPSKLLLKIRILIAEHLNIASIVVLILLVALGYVLVFSPELQKIQQSNISKSLEQERLAKSEYLSQLKLLASYYDGVSQ